jgi:hypothetical protein
VQEGSFGKKSPTLIHPPSPLSVVGVSNNIIDHVDLVDVSRDIVVG